LARILRSIVPINIYWAGLLAMRRVVEGLSLMPQQLLLDARRLKDLSIRPQRIVKGGSRSLTIPLPPSSPKLLRLCQAQWLPGPRVFGRARAARGLDRSPPFLLTGSDGPWPAAIATVAEAE